MLHPSADGQKLFQPGNVGGKKKPQKMVTTQVPPAPGPHPSCPAGWVPGPGEPVRSHEKHFLPMGSKRLSVARMPWAQRSTWASAARAPLLAVSTLCFKSSNWVVGWLAKPKLCTKYSAFCFIMNYFVYLSKEVWLVFCFFFLVFSLQFVPSLLAGVLKSLPFAYEVKCFNQEQKICVL